MHARRARRRGPTAPRAGCAEAGAPRPSLDRDAEACSRRIPPEPPGPLHGALGGILAGGELWPELAGELGPEAGVHAVERDLDRVRLQLEQLADLAGREVGAVAERDKRAVSPR